MAVPLVSADERGLKGLSLDSRVRQLFYSLPPEKICALAQHVPVQARAHQLQARLRLGGVGRQPGPRTG